MKREEIEALNGIDLDRALAGLLGLELVGTDGGAVWVRDGVNMFQFTPTSDWQQFGALMKEHRVALYPTIARGRGAGTGGDPGWMASAEPGQPYVDEHALTAGCRALSERLYTLQRQARITASACLA